MPEFNFSWPPGTGHTRVPKVVQACMTQESHYYLAARRTADLDAQFLEMLEALEPHERAPHVDQLIARFPGRYDRYAGYGTKGPK